MCTILFIALIGMVIGPVDLSAKQKQAAIPVEQPVVVDADGDTLGSVIGLSGSSATVLVSLQGRLFSLYVSKDSLIGTGGPLFFTTNDCTGTPYIPVQLAALVTTSTIARPGSSLYVENPSSIPQLITALSILLGGPQAVCQSTPPPPPPGVPPPGPPQLSAISAIRLVDLNGVFTAPFTIRSGH
jgi:hypothetical protein